MAEGSRGNDTIRMRLELDSKGVNGAAGSAADQLDRLRGAIDKDESALRNMQKALKQLQNATNADADTVKSLEERITKQKDKIAATRTEYINLGGSFDKIRKPAKQSKSQLEELAGAAKGVGGPVGQLGGKVQALFSIIGSAGPLLLLTAGFVALTAAVGAAYTALLAFGFAQADARRDELLRLEGLTKMRFFYQRYGQGMRMAADSASFLQEQVDRVSQSVALGRGEIEGITARLYKMGLRGGTLQTALEGVAIAQSTVGKGQADMYLQMMLGASQTGQSIEAVANDIKARLGPLAEKQMLSWSVQSKKLKENLSNLFGSVGIENLLKPMAEVAKFFSQSEVTGRALKSLLERMFRPVEAAMPVIAHLSKRLLQGMLIGYLAAELQVQKFVGVLLDVLGPALNWVAGQLGLTSTEDAIEMFEKLGQVVGVVVAAGLLTVGAQLAFIGAAAAGAYQGLKRLVALLSGEASKVAKAQGPMWQKVGESIIDGIINGTLLGLPKLIGTIRKHGASVIEAFKGAIGSHSPARKMFDPGFSIATGAAVGVRAGFPKVQDAVRDMAKIPTRVSFQVPKAERERQDEPARPPRFPPPPPPAAPSVRIDQLIVQARSDQPEDLAQAVQDILISKLEGVAIELGAAR